MPHDSSEDKTQQEAETSREPDAPQRPEPAPPPPIATPQIPDHQLLRRIGSGSYGEVWLARNVMGTHRAVKIVYRRTFSSDRPYEREFTGIQKFEPISRSHEGLVDVLQIGRNDRDGYFYYVMELADDAAVVAAPARPPEPRRRRVNARSDRPEKSADEAEVENGMTGKREKEFVPSSPLPVFPFSSPDRYIPKTLSKEIHNRGRLPADECLGLSLTLTSALGHLHKHGLIHRDIKPSNIIFVNGIPKLADIGLVADAAEARSFVGTEGFIPPEGPGTARADLYSLGKVVYEISTGKDRQDFPELPTLMGEEGDRTELLELNEVIVKACEDEPTQRYQSAEEMHGDLVFLQSGKSVKRLRSIERRLSLVTRVTSAIAVAVALGFGIYHLRQRQLKELLAREVQMRQVRLDSQRAELKLAKQLAEEMTVSAMQRVEELFAANKSGLALAELARIVRQNPTNRTAALRLMSALAHRNFALPIAEPLQSDTPAAFLHFSPDGQRIIASTRSVRMSPDGRRVLDSTNSTQVWDWRSGLEVEGTASSDGVSHPDSRGPDGNRIWATSVDQQRSLTVLSNRMLRVWNAKTGEIITTFSAHDGRIHSAEFSRDGRLVVSLSRDNSAMGSVWVWNAETAQVLSGPLEAGWQTHSAKFSPDGQRVVTTADRGDARIWDSKTGLLICAPLTQDREVRYAEFSPDGQLVVTASLDKTARLWDGFTGRPVMEPIQHVYEVTVARFSPDGQFLATVPHRPPAWSPEPGQQKIWIWDIRPGRQRDRTLNHDFPIRHALFSQDGQTIVTVTSNSIVSIRTFQSDDHIRQLNLDTPIENVHFSPDGKKFALVCENHTVRLGDLRTGQLDLKPLKHDGQVISFEFSPDSGRALTGTWAESKTAHLWDLRTAEQIGSPFRHEAPFPQEAVHGHFSRDGRFVVTSAWTNAWVWDGQTGQRVAGPFKHDARIYSGQTLQFSPDGRRILTGSWDKTARIWDRQTGNELTEPLAHRSTVLSAQFSPDGRRVVTGSFDDTARIWDAQTGRPLTEPMQHRAYVFFTEFSPDGDHVITASADGVMRLWDARTGQPASVPLKHNGRTAFASTPAGPNRRWPILSPDWKWIITLSETKTMRIVELATGLLVAEPESDVVTARFNREGNRIIGISHDKRAIIWEVPSPTTPAPGWLAELAEALAGQRLNHQTGFDLVPVEHLWKLRQQVEESTATDDFTRWGQWFFGNRATRSISPRSSNL